MRFEQALEMAGLRPRRVVADGRIRRCPTDSKPGKRNGWFVLHPDGHGYWGDWTSGTGAALGSWREDSSRIDHAAVQRAQERMAQQRAQERRERQAALAAVRQFWHQQCTRPAALHPYLADKGLSALGCDGVRVWRGQMVVPVRQGEALMNVQLINKAGRKLFWKGAPVKGGAYVIERKTAALTVFCEGFATGLAVYQCVKHARVVVAFDAGNLLPVVQSFAPTGNVVLVADNDHGTQARRGFNPGIEKASAAAALVDAGVVWPEGIEGTDFADALREYGEGGAKRIERLIQGAARYVVGTA